MLKNLFKCKGWTVGVINLNDHSIYVELLIDARCVFLCPKCSSKLSSHSIRDINVIDRSVITHSTLLKIQTWQGYCKKCNCFHSFRPSFVHPRRMMTHRFMHYVSFLYASMSAKDVSKLTGLSPASIRRVDSDVLSEKLPHPDFEELDAILVDEKYLGSSFGFVTLVINARTSEPIYLAEGKDQKALDEFFIQLTDDQKKSIRCVGIDRGNAYAASVRKNIPHAAIAYDPFHLVSNMNDVVDKVRRDESKNAPYGIKNLITGNRYNLLRANENNNEDGLEKLYKLLCANESLHEVYVMKEQFRFIFKSNDENHAIIRLSEWISMAMKSSVIPLVRFTKNLAKSLNEVVNSIRYKVTSAAIESTNAKIKRIQSKTCGLFNIKYLFQKIRQIYFISRNLYDQQI